MPSEYFGRVRRIWIKNIAGPVAAICALILPVAGLILHSDRALTVCLAAVPLLIAMILTWPAHYEVWREDRKGREEGAVEERPKPKAVEPPLKPKAVEVDTSRPEIQGELRGFRLSGNPGESRSGNAWRCYANAACQLYVCNSKPVKATLKGLVIDGSALDPPAEFSKVIFIRGADKVLEQGVGVNCDVLMTYTFNGFQWKQIGRVELKNMKVYAIDSFGGKHLLSVPPAETLPTP